MKRKFQKDDMIQWLIISVLYVGMTKYLMRIIFVPIVVEKL